MIKTHKIIIKNKTEKIINLQEAKEFYEKLTNEDLKIKIFDNEKYIYKQCYKNYVGLEKLTDFEFLVENATGLKCDQKKIIYQKIEKEEKENKKVNNEKLKNIINHVRNGYFL